MHSPRKFKIEKGVAPPPHPNTIYPFLAMEIGDSFFVAGASGNKLRAAAYLAGARNQKKFMVRVVDGGLRVWRVA